MEDSDLLETTGRTYCSTVKVLGIPYTVSLADSIVVNGIDPLIGCINNTECAITIRKDLPFENKVLTLFHEILHGVDSSLCGQKLEEEQVLALSHGMFAFLSENGLLKTTELKKLFKGA